MKVNGKKQALQELAAKAARAHRPERARDLRVLLQREKLGSTGIGNGIAIPHGKLPRLGNCSAVRAARQADRFRGARRSAGRLLFLLLAPEGAGADHLKALALLF